MVLEKRKETRINSAQKSSCVLSCAILCLSLLALAGDNLSTASSSFARADHPALVAQVGHSDLIKSVSFSPDNNRSVQLWDAKTGREIRGFYGHEHSVMTASFSSDGKSVLTGAIDYTAKLWDVATGKERQRFVGHKNWVKAAVISRDGRWVLTGSYDHTARLWDAATGKEIHKFTDHTDYVTAVAFSPDAELCVTASLDKTIRVYKRATLEQLVDPIRVSTSVKLTTFLPHDELLLTGDEDGATRLWDVRAGRELRSFRGEHTSEILSISFSSETQTLFTASAERVVSWRFADAQPLRRFEMIDKNISAVALPDDGQQVLTGADDGTTVLRDLAGGKEITRFEGDAIRVHHLSASADGRFVLIGSNTHVAILWDMEKGSEVQRLPNHEGRVSCVAIAPDGSWLFTADTEGVARIWDSSSGRVIQRFEGHHGEITSVAFSSDYSWLLTGGIDNTARMWDRQSGQQLKKFEGHKGAVRSVVFSPDEKFVLTGSDDATARLWLVENEQETGRFIEHYGPVNAVAFSPRGVTVLTGGFDKVLRIWDVESHKVTKRLEGHTEQVSSVAFSSDGSQALSGSWDGTVRLWNVETGTHRSFGPHTGWGAEAVFFKDTKYILAATADGLTRVWDVAAGKALCSLISFEGGAWVVTDPDGRFDTNDIEELRQLSWVMDDDLMTPLPVEIFMRQFFEPRLLQRLFDHDDFGEVPRLTELNRVQPKVTITDVRSAADNTAIVAVEVEGVVRGFERGGKMVGVESGARDLRLFRDGRLVGYSDGDLFATAGATAGVRCEPIEGRRSACRAVFSGVALPKNVQPAETEFYAYAFNSSGVKSDTYRRSLPPGPQRAVPKGRAYLVSVGVSGYENPDWNLRFAAKDARLFAREVGQSLRATNAFEDVVEVLLTSDESDPPDALKTKGATKENFRKVLRRLAGDNNSVAGVGNLKKVTPDDLLIIFYSSHGFRDEENFYLFPFDIGNTRGRDMESVLPHCITNNDLYLWLRDLDAGELVLIVDACHAEAAIRPESGFKPGPMGSRGMGQLAYDKGMRILAATQPDTTAAEVDNINQRGKIQHGLLTRWL
jgi:WD40 repeat protein